MPLDRSNIAALVEQLAGVAAVLAPGHAGTVAALRGLLEVGTELHDLIARIRREDPEAWAAVSADFNSALAGFEASVARSREDT